MDVGQQGPSSQRLDSAGFGEHRIHARGATLMKQSLTVSALVLLVILGLACATPTTPQTPAPVPTPPPNLAATIEALAAIVESPPTTTPVPPEQPPPTPIPTETPSPTATMPPAPTATPTPTLTPTPFPTAIPTPIPTATRRPTRTPIPTRTPTPIPDPSAPIYGPASGYIVHQPDDEFLEVFRGPGVAKNVMIEATFKNPYPTSKGDWNYGFLLAQRKVNFYHWMRIRSDGTWDHSYRPGPDADRVTLRQESPPSIDTTPQGKNRIRLVIIGEDGWLYINNQFQGNLSLGAVDFDRVQLVLGDEVAGQSTRFDGFAIWKWDSSLAALPVATPVPSAQVPYVPIYGPASGEIRHEIQKPVNLFEVFRGATIEGDKMVEATFYNPFSTSEGRWNYGIFLRNSGRGVYHWLNIDSSGRWNHSITLGEEQEFRMDARWETISHFDGTSGGKNTLRLVVIEDSVWVYINGRFHGNTNLSAIPGDGPVTLVVNDLQEGTTRFENFAIWKWHPSLQELPKPDDD